MRNYRFTINFEDELDLDSLQITVYDKDLLHQIKNVLRLNQDSKEEISFIDGSGKVYFVKILDLKQETIRFKIYKVESSKRELEKEIIFLLPVIKMDAFSLMLRKLTELGVQTMIPINFSRSQKQNLVSLGKDNQKQRFEKIIQEATEQCEGAIFPELKEVSSLEQVIAELEENVLKIFASERMADQDFNQNFAVDGDIVNFKKICLLVGPEGGLSDEEVELLIRNGFRQYSLGKRLLKAETAAISLFSSLNLN